MHPNNADKNKSQDISNPACLRAISEKFQRLTQIKSSFSQEFSAEVIGLPGTKQSNELLETFIDPIDDELHELGWLASETASANKDHMRRKAAILEDLLEDDPTDLVACLTRSLIKDLK
ncbi:MAG: hypothetical protein AAF346_10985, partial [Pseudomonadota bacterium]